MPTVSGVALLLTLFVSGAAPAVEPASASPTPSVPSSWPTASTNSAWFARAWRSDDGLPGNTVVGIAQTPDGFLWVATDSGLVCFDGVRFQETASLPMGGKIVAFLADHQGRLWLGKKSAKGSAQVICLEAGKPRVFSQPDKLPVLPVLGMAEDGEGAVWSAHPSLACRIKDGRLSFFPKLSGWPVGRGTGYLAGDGRGQLWFARSDSVGVYREGRFHTLLRLNHACGALQGASSGGVWIGVGARVLKYDGQGEPQPIGQLEPDQLGTEPTAFCEDSRGQLWVGTAKAGLFLYNGVGFDRVARPGYEITCLAEDREGSLWAGTSGGGLVRVRPRAFALESVGSSQEGVRSVCQDPAGTLWAVTQSGRLARKQEERWQVLSAKDGWFGSNATCVTAAPAGGVWVGTESEGLRWWRQGEVRSLTTQDGLAANRVTALLATPAGDIWIATMTSNAVQRLRDGQLETFLLPQTMGHYSSLAVDASGDVWAATEGGHLQRVSHAGRLEAFANTMGSGYPINSLCATPDGSLWIGYSDQGVGRLNQGRFNGFSTQQELPDSRILQMVADRSGRLWFAANRGLFCIPQAEFDQVAQGRQARLHSITYGVEEGVAGSQASKSFCPGIWRSTDGRLWISMVNGVMVVDPSQLTENRVPPPVVIERVAVDGQTAALYQSSLNPEVPGASPPLELHQANARLRLPPGTRHVELEYTGLSFVSPRNVAFKYRLKGFDSGWVPAGARRVAYYSSLPPGHYRFEVMARNNDGVWSQTPASLGLTVLPHFWQTWWFIGCVALGALGAVGETARRTERRKTRQARERLEHVRAIESERNRIAQDLHDELGSRLTRVANLGALAMRDSRSFEEMKSHLGSLSEQVRGLLTAMDEVVWTISPQNDSLPSLVAFLSDYTERFLAPTGIGHRLELDPEFPPLPVAAQARHHLLLATKEVLNNAVRHAAPKIIHLKVHVQEGSLEIAVSDDGRGFNVQPAGRRGHGLGNVERRLKLLQGRPTFTSEPGKGTTVTLLVPLAGLSGLEAGTSFDV